MSQVWVTDTFTLPFFLLVFVFAIFSLYPGFHWGSLQSSVNSQNRALMVIQSILSWLPSLTSLELWVRKLGNAGQSHFCCNVPGRCDLLEKLLVGESINVGCPWAFRLVSWEVTKFPAWERQRTPQLWLHDLLFFPRTWPKLVTSE